MESRRTFSPTDIFFIPKGVPFIHVLSKADVLGRLEDPGYQRDFLEFNSLLGIMLKSSKDRFVFGHHRAFSDHLPEHDQLFTEHRMRSLSLITYIYRSLGIDADLERLKDLPLVEILEIGSGNGRALLEMAQLIPEARFTGTGREKGEEGFYGNETLKKIAPYFNLPSPSPRMNFDFFDLSEGILPYSDNSFDLVFTRSAVRYLRRKDVLLSEIQRTLKPGGTAFVDLSHFKIEDGSLESVFGKNYDPATFSLRLTKEMNFHFEFLVEASKQEVWDPKRMNHTGVGWETVVRVRR
jgi:SAM-dependent methyltransferase